MLGTAAQIPDMAVDEVHHARLADPHPAAKRHLHAGVFPGIEDTDHRPLPVPAVFNAVTAGDIGQSAQLHQRQHKIG